MMMLKFDKNIHFNAEDIEPMLTYGTNPGMGIKIQKLFQKKMMHHLKNH